MLRISLIIAIAWTATISSRVDAASLVNSVAAIVNDTIITRDDVLRETKSTLDYIKTSYARDPRALAQASEQALRNGIESLVQRRLIIDAFESLGNPANERLIEDVIAEQVRVEFGSRVDLIKTLQQEGRTLESYRKGIREKWIVDVMTSQNVSSEVIISPYKIQRYYLENLEQYKLKNQVKLRMIVISKPKQGEDSEAIAKEILAKLDEGIPFAEMAKLYSDGSHRGEGGDVGWIESDFLREDLSEVAFSLSGGERSGIIDRPEALYLMFAEAKRAAHVRPLEDVREEIEDVLLRDERRRLSNKWIDGLKEKAFVRYFF